MTFDRDQHAARVTDALRRFEQKNGASVQASWENRSAATSVSVGPNEARVEIPMHLPSANNLREHYLVKASRVKRQRQTTTLALLTAGVPRTLPAVVTLTRIASRPLDGDNLQGAFKAVRDAVAAYLETDDGPSAPVRWEYAQRRGEPRQKAIEIVIRPDCMPDA